MTISDDYFWWQFLTTISDDNFWWQFLMTISDDNFWQFLTTETIETTATIETIFDNFEKTILETCDIWDTDYNSDNLEPEFRQSFLPDN